MVPKSSRIVSRKLVFLYYYSRLFNEEVLAHPETVEDVVIQETNHVELNELTNWLWIEDDELMASQTPIAATVTIMDDESMKSDVEFIAQYQLAQHTNIKVVHYDTDYVEMMSAGYSIYRSRIADLIAPYTDRFTYDEMSLTRRAILLLGYAEHKILLTPSTIVINECVELAKNYEDDAAWKLINGIMHKLLWVDEQKKVEHKKKINIEAAEE